MEALAYAADVPFCSCDDIFISSHPPRWIIEPIARFQIGS